MGKSGDSASGLHQVPSHESDLKGKHRTTARRHRHNGFEKRRKSRLKRRDKSNYWNILHTDGATGLK